MTDRDSGRVKVSNSKILFTVVIEISDNYGSRTIANRNLDSRYRRKSSSAVSITNRDAVSTKVIYGEVLFGIAVEVSDGNSVRPGTGRDIGQRSKCPIANAPSDRDVI